MSSAPVVPILFGGLIAWSVYRRVRRNIGRQKLRPRRITFSIVVFCIVSVLVVGTSLQNPRLLLGFGGGFLLGALLGFFGLRLTRFETIAEGHFYTPNTHIGIGLSILFAGRIAYHYLPGTAAAAQNPAMPFHSPLTLFIFGLIAGYYIVYYIGLFVHTRDKK